MFLRSRNVHTPPSSAEIPPSDTSDVAGRRHDHRGRARGLANVIEEGAATIRRVRAAAVRDARVEEDRRADGEGKRDRLP